MPPDPDLPVSARRPPSYDAEKVGYTGISSGLLDTIEDLRTARAFAEMVVDTVREGLLVLDLDLRVVAANESFYDLFGAVPEETVGRLVYDLGNGQWDIPELRGLLEGVLPEARAFNDYKVDHQFEGIGRRVVVLNGRQMDDHRLILLAVDDVTERYAEAARAEAALRESEEKYRSLFQTMGQGYVEGEVVRDGGGRAVDHRILDVNPAFERLSGLRAGEVRGRLASEVVPGLGPSWSAAIGEVVRSGVPGRFEREGASTGQWYEVRVYPSSGDRFVELYEDVTERKRAERRHAFLLELADALRALSDPGEVQETVTRLALDHFGADRCYYAEVQGGEAVIWMDTFREGLLPVAGTYDLGTMPLFWSTVEAGRAFDVEDVDASTIVDPPLRQLCHTYEVASFLCVPVIKAGRPAGVFCLTQRTPRVWTGAEVTLAEEVAERVWTGLERARAEGALRRSEERYRKLFESIDEGFCIIEVLFDDDGDPVDYRFLEVNPAFEGQTGLSDAVGERVKVLVPEHEAHWFETYGRIARTGRPERFTHEARALGRWYDVYAFRVGDPAERRVAVLFNDVSEQRRAEAEVRELNRTLEARVEERTAQVRALSRALTMAEHEERRRLAQVLHDDLQQVLHGAQIQAALGNTGRVEALLDEAFQTARSLSHELAPPILRGRSLGELFEWVAERKRRLYGLEVELDGGDVEVPEEEARVLLYQVLRELLFNVSKHAGTGRARVWAESCGESVRVVVEDEGAGFDPSALGALQGSGFGLASVRERLEAVGGRLDVASAPGAGTRVTIEVPSGPADG